jgi:hypothetical protein
MKPLDWDAEDEAGALADFWAEGCDRCGRPRRDHDDGECPPPPAVDDMVVARCAECHGTGTREYQTGRYWADYVVEPCRWCKGTGAAPRLAAPPGEGEAAPVVVGRDLPPAA